MSLKKWIDHHLAKFWEKDLGLMSTVLQLYALIGLLLPRNFISFSKAQIDWGPAMDKELKQMQSDRHAAYW